MSKKWKKKTEIPIITVSSPVGGNPNELIDFLVKIKPKWTELTKNKKMLKDYSKLMVDINSKKPDGEEPLPTPIAIWINSRYIVQEYDVSEEYNMPITHLSIKNNHNNHLAHDWRDLQRIKNEICGEEKEAVEVYPAMSRMVDTSNQFHLWVFMDKAPITLGWEKGMVLESQEEADEISHLYNLRKGQTSQRTMEKGFI